MGEKPPVSREGEVWSEAREVFDLINSEHFQTYEAGRRYFQAVKQILKDETGNEPTRDQIVVKMRALSVAVRILDHERVTADKAAGILKEPVFNADEYDTSLPDSEQWGPEWSAVMDRRDDLRPEDDR